MHHRCIHGNTLFVPFGVTQLVRRVQAAQSKFMQRVLPKYKDVRSFLMFEACEHDGMSNDETSWQER